MICTEGREKVYVCTKTHTCAHTYVCVWQACPYCCPQVSHMAQMVKNPPTNARDAM